MPAPTAPTGKITLGKAIAMASDVANWLDDEINRHESDAWHESEKGQAYADAKDSADDLVEKLGEVENAG